MERNCEMCGEPFRARPVDVRAGKARFCSADCFSTSRRGPQKEGIRHRMVRAKGHPIAPPSGIAAVSRIALYDKIGGGEHPCHWCGELVEWVVGVGVRDPRALLVDHVDHDATNDGPGNLVPSCNSCNAHRRSHGDSPIIRPGEVVVFAGGNLRRGVDRNCEYCGATFVVAASDVRLGRGRFCSRSCARSKPRSHS